MKIATCILLVAISVLTGCQSVTYRVDVSGDNSRVDFNGRADIAKPIEVSPARSVEAKDNTLPRH